MAWAYIGLTTAFSLGSRIVMQWKSPELAAEHGKFSQNEGIKAWDKVLMPLILIITIVMLIVAGLDRRFEWSPNLPVWIYTAAFATTALGYSLSTWAMLVNRFISPLVRIQRDRGHVVVTSGPYRFVRHPGYAGAAATSVATPLLLGSLWALVPAALAICLLIVRTALEDRTLQEEMEGYHDHTARVRFRLLPGLW